MIIPATFTPSKRAPSLQELDWLHNWLSGNKDKYNLEKVLEYGCGITSWVLFDALNPKIQVAMEAFQPCIDITVKHVPNIQMIKTNWNDIPKIKYDVLFVDASTNPPPDLKPMHKTIFRNDAIKYSESFISEKAIVILHDWNYKEGWRLPRKYVEDNGYTLIASLSTKFGFGIYQK